MQERQAKLRFGSSSAVSESKHALLSVAREAARRELFESAAAVREASVWARTQRKPVKRKLVWARGNTDATFMIIGEAPGRNENKQGSPFVGVSGGLLDDELKDRGISSQDDFYICNVLKLWPGEGNPDPTYDQVLAHRPWLCRQISIVRPTHIVTLGAWASRFVLCSFGEAAGADSAENLETAMEAQGAMAWLNGSTLSMTWRGTTYKVLPVYHPSAALRETETMHAFLAGLDVVAAAFKTAPSAVTSSVERHYPPMRDASVSVASAFAKLQRRVPSSVVATRKAERAAVKKADVERAAKRSAKRRARKQAQRDRNSGPRQATLQTLFQKAKTTAMSRLPSWREVRGEVRLPLHAYSAAWTLAGRHRILPQLSPFSLDSESSDEDVEVIF